MMESLRAGSLSGESRVQSRAFRIWEEDERGSVQKGAGGRVMGTVGVRERRKSLLGEGQWSHTASGC